MCVLVFAVADIFNILVPPADCPSYTVAVAVSLPAVNRRARNLCLCAVELCPSLVALLPVAPVAMLVEFASPWNEIPIYYPPKKRRPKPPLLIIYYDTLAFCM